MGKLRLAGTCWKLNAFRREDSITPAVPGADSTLRFDNAGGAAGFGGRSAFQALYQEGDEEISITRLETAGEAGPGLPGTAEQEERFLAGLAAAARFKALDGQLILTWNGGREALLFEAARPSRVPGIGHSPE
jgi:heat shock protein HslJ